jgi:hypothetical protein
MISPHRVVVAICPHANGPTRIGRKCNKITCLARVKTLVELATTFVTVLNTRVLLHSMTMNEMQSQRLAIFLREVNAQLRDAATRGLIGHSCSPDFFQRRRASRDKRKPTPHLP